MTTEEARILINAGEDSKIERKREINLSTNSGKGEFLLDILSLVNSHGHEPAYLLIGVRNDGSLYDVSHFHYDDANFQQVVSSGIEPRVDFVYTPLEIEGKSIGVIIIQPSDQRFHVLLKDCADDTGKKFAYKGETRIKVGTSKNRPTAYDYQKLRESILHRLVRQAELTLSFEDGSTTLEVEPSTVTVTNELPFDFVAALTGSGLSSSVPATRQVTRDIRDTVRLHIFVSNTGRAPAEDIVVEITPPAGRKFKGLSSEKGWTPSKLAQSGGIRFDGGRLSHHDRMALIDTEILLEQENRSYEIAWRIFAGNVDEMRSGVLIINYGWSQD